MEPISTDASSRRDMQLSAGLYVLATPLGNLGDITLRAIETLKSAACVACEDTRVTRDLLRLLHIEAPTLISVREHNERAQADTVIARIANGEAVVYASDAGTPAISDPGARLVDAVREAGHAVIPIPGVSAVTAALSVSGFENTVFTFLGFAPTAKGELETFVEAMSQATATHVFFESPHRVEKTLGVLAAQLEPRQRVMIARELTKKFETIAVMHAEDIAAWAQENAATLRGEFVIAVEGAAEKAASASSAIEARSLLKVLLTELPAAKAAKLAAQVTGESRDALYTLASSLRKDGDDKYGAGKDGDR